jgi:hypothetical protein
LAGDIKNNSYTKYMTKEEILAIIDAELQGNLMILIDPKQKDSLSQMRINTWKETVKERLYYHLIENNL